MRRGQKIKDSIYFILFPATAPGRENELPAPRAPMPNDIFATVSGSASGKWQVVPAMPIAVLRECNARWAHATLNG
jgi:hypothetical protein